MSTGASPTGPADPRSSPAGTRPTGLADTRTTDLADTGTTGLPDTRSTRGRSPGRWRTFVPGQRVVVRRRRDDHPAPHEPQLTDVLGEVVEVTDDGLRIAGRHGETWVPAADVVAAKAVPPPPRR